MKPTPRELTESFGKLPPQALELEEALLGSVLLESQVLSDLLHCGLQAEHFYSEAHQLIYQACLQLYNNANPVDMRTIVNHLRTNGTIEQVGGAFKIAQLTTNVSSAANAEYYARIVQEKHMLRQLIQLASTIHQQAYNEADVFELMEQTTSNLFNIDVSRTGTQQLIDATSLYSDTLKNLQAKKKNTGITGIDTGFKQLNIITSGWQPSDLIIVAARPGMGKTAFMLKTMRHAAGKGYPVLVFSLEMNSVQLMERLMSAEHEIYNDKMRSGNLNDYDYKLLMDDKPSQADLTSLHASRFFITDTPATSITEARAIARRMHAKHGIKMIVVDYLQLMRGERERNGNREQEIASISRGLKTIAKELNVPVIALSQLSRGVESRPDKRPMLSDLRESGSIEQDADLVSFLYRPEYYNISIDEDGMPTADMAEVIIAKHRNGGTGTVKVKFDKYFTRFVDL